MILIYLMFFGYEINYFIIIIFTINHISSLFNLNYFTNFYLIIVFYCYILYYFFNLRMAYRNLIIIIP